MGLRGPGAKPKKLPTWTSSEEPSGSPARHPWDVPGLTRAERVIAFVESLPVTQGPLAGTSFRLRDWQRDFIEAVYAVEPDGRRPVRTAVLSMGRKNGKTQVAAMLALCALSGPEAESRGEVYSAANDRAQAAKTFNEMVAVIQRTPWLSDRINVRRFTKELEDLDNGSIYAALSADVATKLGLNPSAVVIDELGAASSRHLFDALDTAMGGRDEPLLIVISTQAARDEAPLSQLIDYGLKIQRGEIADPSFHLTLFTAPPEADPWVEATWKLANPALGDFRSLEDVRRLARQAQRMPAAEAAFKQLILNMRCDGTAQFITAPMWAACAPPTDPALLKGRPCWAGLDLGATRDMTALVLAFRDDDGAFDVVPYCWLPGETLHEREDEDRMPYRQWAKEGHLLTFPGRTTDPKTVALRIAELHAQYKFEALAYDRWRIEDLRRELAAIGAEDVPLVPHGQGFRDMDVAVNALERLVIEGTLRHGNHPVLSMAAANAKIETDAAGNRKLSKRKSTGRIDPLVAAAMSLAAAQRHEEAPVWEPWGETV